MKNHSLGTRSSRASLSICLMLSLSTILATASAKDKDKKDAPARDSISVVGHLTLSQTSITNIQGLEDFSRRVVELMDHANHTLTLVDVADPAHPRVLKQLQIPKQVEEASLALQIGNAALFTEAIPSQQPVAPKSITVISFADPERPATVRQFDNVTALWVDRTHGMIYLANTEGLWILQMHSASDHAFQEKEFEQMLGP
jgi:hypothetical protein